ncbi:NADP-dependent oxidoreductase [Agrobacterium rosae]|uniref:Alcohol dehydrogenase n=1 Tax=Agrobacterium rosae TaxID=1972867 RepID=A0AAE5S081_9HYPH|nr:NADP-dependent oxidoreductase [Agrobacterium rosae]KAA3512883.1 NADP-dependent oxidoreductase [Agrobacterium rosae]KAA3521629.1 NADP-dependent oxidoreductase [Agrobacterium rosae]MCM2432484.1 NADP-dependent oxidoreductase [Agrobacterium rosae]MDX8328445.1 NADP-dependent oxidoreductase [Agrobacterium rosae]MQB48562.1 NADP-dependent oxidoreductase [Agrobacterium rosae]
MQRIQYHRYGGPDVMRLEDYELPALGRQEILVRVKAASINPLDWKLRQGFMKLMMGRRFPRAMGMDFAGVVEAIGPGVTGFAPGDDVLGQVPMMKPGAFAEAAITTQDLIIHKPAALSFPAAATLPTVGVTAWRALIDGGRLKAGQSLFINGAAGGVGQAATAIAKTLGAVITVRVGPSSLASFADMGMARVLDYTQALPENLKGTFDVVFDCHGGLTSAEEDFLTKRSGIAVDIDPTVGNVFRSLISSRHNFVRGVLSTSILQKIVDLALAGQFTIPINRIVSLSEAIALISDLEAGNRLPGKSVILMG